MIQKIYTLGKYGRNRIFMTAVLGYNFKSQRYVPAPNVWETSFENRKELINELADWTDTRGRFRPTGDPNYWTNNVIDRQASKSKEARTWSRASEPPFWWHRYLDSDWEGNWDFWFHDADGETIDVRKFWPEVIAEVRRRLQSFEQCGGTRRMWRWKQSNHTRFRRGYHPKKGRAGVGSYCRDFYESRKYYDDEDNLVYFWEPRGKLHIGAFALADYGYDWRSRHSVGWKAHKHRRQWERRLREQEKHRRNRERRTVRRNGYFAENESDSE